MKYLLETIVFICGACLMILELVGSRILSPYIGTSTVVWTSLIGIIMACLSFGYWQGGKLADMGANYKKLSIIIACSAFFIFLIVFLSNPVLSFATNYFSNLYVSTIFVTIVLFSLPSFLLGMISPFAVKIKMEDISLSGRTVGNLYAISTVGSIVGTFAAGFLLIPFLGTLRILYFISFCLIATSLLAYYQKIFKFKFVAILIFCLISFFYLSEKGLAKEGVIDIDTQYNRILLTKSEDIVSKRPILELKTDPHGTQSAMFLDNDNDLVFEYTKFYRLVDHFNKNVKEALILGGAAYSYPKDFLKSHPDANMDVVEIDPGMTKVAKKYFNLKDSERLNIYHEDGRIFLNRNEKKYDAIFSDAFNNRLSIPHQLTTIEATQKIYDSLNDEGVALVNVISSVEGSKSKFLQAEYKTYKEVFPQVYLFVISDITKPQMPQNLMLISLKSEIKPKWINDDYELNNYLKNLWIEDVKDDYPILTDDYAPVDYYMMSTLY